MVMRLKAWPENSEHLADPLVEERRKRDTFDLGLEIYKCKAKLLLALWMTLLRLIFEWIILILEMFGRCFGSKEFRINLLKQIYQKKCNEMRVEFRLMAKKC